MSGVDVLAHALTIAALAALALLGLRVWRATPERVTTRAGAGHGQAPVGRSGSPRAAGTAALTAVSALLAGYLLTMAQPFPVRVGLVIHARVSVIAALALAVLASAHATRSTTKASR